MFAIKLVSQLGSVSHLDGAATKWQHTQEKHTEQRTETSLSKTALSRTVMVLGSSLPTCHVHPKLCARKKMELKAHAKLRASRTGAPA